MDGFTPTLVVDIATAALVAYGYYFDIEYTYFMQFKGVRYGVNEE